MTRPGRVTAAGHPQQRRLAGAVGPEEGKHRRRRNDEVDAMNDLDAAVARPDVDQLQGRRGTVVAVAAPVADPAHDDGSAEAALHDWLGGGPFTAPEPGPQALDVVGDLGHAA